MPKKIGTVTDFNGYYGKIVTEDNEEYILLKDNIYNNDEIKLYKGATVSFIDESKNDNSTIRIARFVKKENDKVRDRSDNSI